MEIKELIEFLKEKGNEGIKDIEFEDYNGNTLFHLSDLNIADVESDTLRLQIRQPRFIGYVKEYQNNVGTFRRVKEGDFSLGHLRRGDIVQAFEDSLDEDNEDEAKVIKAVQDNVDNIDDKNMTWLAEKMSEAYTGDDYWDTLKSFAKNYFSKELKLETRRG